jgi:type II secretory ATPase GspE/PulE/Tfp pilus assembly ATPase PilB-like protein
MELFASVSGWTDPSVLLLGAVYASPWKLLGLLVLGAAWAKYAEWADKDAVAVNTLRQLWNLGTLGVGLAILTCAVLVPNFWIGHGIAWVVLLGYAGAYILHRNSLVETEYTLLTADHFRRIREQGLFGKKEKKEREVVERVQLRGPKGVLRVPEDEESREAYADTQDLLYELLLRRASRAELAPSGEIAKVAYEVDGQAVERDPLDRVAGDGIVNYVKQSLGLNLEEKRKPQTGKLVAKIAEAEFELRIRTDGSVAGEKLTIRVIGPEKKWKVADIGFTDKQMVEIQNIIAGDPGVVLISGPKRNGLTTTVYSFTRSHDAFLQNIQLLEYVNELEIDNVTQKLYQPAETTTFTDELMRIIRSDPDILIVPELREPPAAAALAKAGQKTRIYTMVQAADAVEAIRRWMQLVAERRRASARC